MYFFIGGGAFFTFRGEQLAALALRYAVPTVYEGRDFVMAGGLLSYGGSLTDSYRLADRYAGRVLNGEKPADLPVQQSTKVEMFLNLRTAEEVIEQNTIYRNAGVRCWHESEVRYAVAHVGYPGKTGQHLLVLSFTGFGP